jgi:molecular chaperone DnaK
VHETEKSLAEHKAKLSPADVTSIESAKETLKNAAKGDDKAALEKALSEFQRAAQKLGELVYKESQASAGAPPPGGPQGGFQGAPGGSAGARGGDEPVDADFEVKQ